MAHEQDSVSFGTEWLPYSATVTSGVNEGRNMSFMNSALQN